jgi:hypothetical protein
MTIPFIREMIREAKDLGLTDVAIINQKRHACLVATNPKNGAIVRLGLGRSKHGTSNFRAYATARADLRRQIRGVT